MKIVSDPERTAERRGQLDVYMTMNVMADENFVCASEQACKSSLKPSGLTFARGQLSHVGSHYDLTISGAPVRILVIGMDTGRPDEFVTVAERHQQVMDSALQTFSARNPHMRGTTSALRVLLADHPGDDDDGEWLALEGGGTAHVFDAFALANLRLCSAIKPPSSESKGTKVMSANCLRHLEATVKILQPTIVVLQSKQIRPAIRSLLMDSERVSQSLEKVTLCGVPVLLAEFSHPSYPATKMHWGRVKSAPYLWDVIVPTLERTRELATQRSGKESEESEAPVDPAHDFEDALTRAIGACQDQEAADIDPRLSDNQDVVAGQTSLASEHADADEVDSRSEDSEVAQTGSDANQDSQKRSLVSTGKDRVQRIIRSLGVVGLSLASRAKRNRSERSEKPRRAPRKPRRPKTPSPILGLPDEESRPDLPRRTGYSGPSIEICEACDSPIQGGARCGCS